MTPSENECREAFEKWADETAEYANGSAGDAWRGWQAAWNARSKDVVDARRYRWMRNTTDGSVDDAVIERHWEESWLLCGEGLDEAIDAAMSETDGGKVWSAIATSTLPNKSAQTAAMRSINTVTRKRSLIIAASPIAGVMAPAFAWLHPEPMNAPWFSILEWEVSSERHDEEGDDIGAG